MIGTREMKAIVASCALTNEIIDIVIKDHPEILSKAMIQTVDKHPELFKEALEEVKKKKEEFETELLERLKEEGDKKKCLSTTRR